MVAYLQRVAGYCLTGSIREHAVFFAHGPGGNGKGVFINTLTRLFGDYAAVSSMDTFTATKNEPHPTGVAMLRGARMVSAQETDEGRHWDEAKIKALSGGDPITARFMRQNFFTFEPTFKLLVAGNHRPAIRNVDPAMKRRLQLIPFEVRIPNPDKDLADKLVAEWPGIFAWMIEGCLEWQRIGLAPPDAVLIATNEYFEDEDALGRWLHERCEIKADAYSTTADLFASWKAWATEAGEEVGSDKRLSQALKKRGFKGDWKHPRTRQKGFRGIRARQDWERDDPPAYAAAPNSSSRAPLF